MSLEGELQITLRLAQRRVAGVQVRSTRPDVAAALLQGRTSAEVQAAVPMLFSVCGRSQAAACTLACAAALGEPPAAELLAGLQAGVTAERVREAALQVLLHWPRWLLPTPETPSAPALAAARAVQGFDGDARGAAARAIAEAAWGMPAEAWLRLDTAAELADWAARSPQAAARYVRQLLRAAEAAARRSDVDGGAAAPTALLPAEPDLAWLQQLAAALHADPRFERHPTWNGVPAETGGLARQQHDTLIRSLAGLDRDAPGAGAHSPPAAGEGVAGEQRVLGRYVARLRELARLLTRPAAQQPGSLSLPDATGLGWVHNARGLLVHLAQLRAGRVQAYRIVAPTEWNFHPQGALVQSLLHGPANDVADLHARATRLIHSLDPCVACRVEIQNA